MTAFRKQLKAYESTTNRREDILISSDQIKIDNTTLTTAIEDLKTKTEGLESDQSVTDYIAAELEPVQSDISDLQTTTNTQGTDISNLQAKLTGISTTVTDYVDAASDTLTTNLNTFIGIAEDSVSGLDSRVSGTENKLTGIDTTVTDYIASQVGNSSSDLGERIDTLISDTSVLSSRVDTVETDKLSGVMLDGVLQTMNTETQVANLDLSNYATKNDIASVQRYKGTVSSYSDLLAMTSPQLGDTYNVTNAGGTDSKGIPVKAGDNVAYGDTGWDVLAGSTDLTAYLTKSEASDTYVTKVAGKGLSTNDLTDELVSKIESQSSGGITAIKIDDVVQSVSSNTATLNLSGYVKKETGKQLSQYNFDDTLNTKLNNASTAASSAVQSIKLDNVTQSIDPITRQVTLNLSNYATTAAVSSDYVAKETGKQLSTEDFTTALKTKLEGTVTDISLDSVTQAKDANGAVTLDLSNYATNMLVSNNYVQKEAGRGLSEVDFTTTRKEKLDNALTGITIDGSSQTVTNSVANLDLSNYATKSDISSLASSTDISDNYVQKEAGKGLSTNDLTNELINTISDTAVTASTALQGITLNGNIQTVTDNIASLDLSDYATTSAVSANYVAIDPNKGLSENDFTTAYKTKLDSAITGVTLNGNTQTVTDSVADLDLSDYATTSVVSANFVAKETGKGLSTEDYTTAEKTKLSNALTGVSINGTVQDISSDTAVLDLSDYATTSSVSANYVAKEANKQLSTEDFTTAYKGTVDNLASSAVTGIQINGTNQTVTSNVASLDLSDYVTTSSVSANYVAKEAGKGLSEVDFTSVDKNKLDHLDPYSVMNIIDGVAGTYGPSANETAAAVITPEITVDSHGLVTSVTARTTTINNVASASYATTAGTATTAGSSTNAGYAATAGTATTATNAPNYLPLSGGTINGSLRLQSGNYGTKLNFGDGEYVYLHEESDDRLTVKANAISMVGTVSMTGAVNIASMATPITLSSTRFGFKGTMSWVNNSAHIEIDPPYFSVSGSDWAGSYLANVNNMQPGIYYIRGGTNPALGQVYGGWVYRPGSGNFTVLRMMAASGNYEFIKNGTHPLYAYRAIEQWDTSASDWVATSAYLLSLSRLNSDFVWRSATHATSATGATSASVATTSAKYATSAGAATNAGSAASAARWTTERRIAGLYTTGAANTFLAGICTTAAATAEKAVTITGASAVASTVIFVAFTYKNTAASPTLNLNGTGAQPIYTYGTTRPTGFTAGAKGAVGFEFWSAGWRILTVS